ncbi:endonuclease I family protein [Rubrivirga sp. IMCC43871]|uniref:endonuclease I family protein n=1 Tax=Rubrivirga sp. IMCC43871 TaxID=3391575 RepID=UPI0039903297
MPVRFLVLALAVSACGGDRVSTAGAFDDDSGGVSTAGTFDDGPTPGAASDPAALLAAVDRDFSPDRTLGYARARDVLYAHENDAGGVCGLYTGWCIRLGPGDESQAAMAAGMNAEHVWPQSMGARAEPLKSDLHHLFPEREGVNSSRGNLPFGEVPDRRADAWYRADASQSNTPRADIDGWAERGAGLFEPPQARKGDVARAVFYVAAVYPDRADPAFFQTMREDLLAWNRADPPDAAERARSAWVASLQGTENPFVGDPALADRIWGAGPITPEPSASAPPTPAPAARGALSVSEIHYDNAGADTGEGVEVRGDPGTALGGWTLALYNGSGGRLYETVSLSGTLPASGAVWTPVVLQNGSPDGLALVAPDGAVTVFWSYEGTFTAADGPAQGRTSTDLGAAQPSDTPPGTTLHATPSGWRLAPASPGR